MGTNSEMTLEHAARGAAGNWRSWTCFVWDRLREIDDPDDWAIIYTHHRRQWAAGPVVNAACHRPLCSRPFSETENSDVVFESHSPRWAVRACRRFQHPGLS